MTINELPVWRCEDVLSGDFWYSLDEPELCVAGLTYYQATTFGELPEFFKGELAPYVHEYI